MPPDKSTILESAQLYAARGQYDKAIAEWKKLAATAPADGTVQNTIGDLHLKRNAPTEAVEAFLAAAAAFQAAGAPLKAIAVYKKILKVEPGRYLIYKQLGDLNAERGLVSNAISDYLVLAKGCLKEGLVGDAIAVYRTIIRLDPSQVEVRQRLAALCLQENRRDEAVEAYLELGRDWLGQGRAAEAREACQAALRIEPESRQARQLLRTLDGEQDEGDSPAARDAAPAPGPGERGDGSRQGSLSRALKFMDQGQYDAAETLLAELLSAEPGDPEICRLLASLHLRRGQLAVAQSEFKFLVESAMRAQDYPLAEAMIRECLEADPDCVVFTELLGQCYEHTGDPVSAAAQYGKALELLLAHPDPDDPALPLELFGKVALLDPTSPLHARYAPLFEPVPGREAAEPEGAHGPERAAPPAASDAAPPPFTFKPAGSVAPADAPAEAGPVTRPPGIGFRFVGEAEGPVGETGADGLPPAEDAVPAGEARGTYDAHLELGTAYRRLGLLDEALDELRIAAEGPDTFVTASLEAARCWAERGDVPAAIAGLERALCDPRSEGGGGTPLRDELAWLEQMRPLPQPSTGGEPADVQAASASERKKRRISYL